MGETPETGSAEELLVSLTTGPWVFQALYAAAKLDVPDRLVNGDRHVDELAGECDVHPDALYRLLRALNAAGIFDEPAPGRFALNTTADLLRGDRSGTHKYFTVMHGEEVYVAFSRILDAIRTGEPVFKDLYGKPYFEYLDDNPEASALFNAAIGGGAGAVPAVLQEVSLAGASTVIDVGGGTGSLLRDVLERAPDVKGVLLDRPEAIGDVRMELREGPLAERCSLISGDFFREVPAGGDVYILSHILHDWNETDCLRILSNVRQGMPSGSRLLIFEWVLGEGAASAQAKISDLLMLVVLGGRERTADEFQELLARAGFEMRAVHRAPPATPSGPGSETCIEAVVKKE